MRGVNYVPSYSRNPVEIWADYDAATVERELSYARRLNLNAVRVFLHMFAWAWDPARFLASYDHFVGACAARGGSGFGTRTPLPVALCASRACASR